MPRIRKQSQSLKETAIKIWKVALYIRLSKEDGHGVSYSVENQKQRLLQYLELSEEEMDLVDIYIDDATPERTATVLVSNTCLQIYGQKRLTA